MAQVERLKFRAMGTDAEIIIADSNLPAAEARLDILAAKAEIIALNCSCRALSRPVTSPG